MSIITATEFTRLLASSKPPTGWGKSITLALSGGPDSLCLLFLLHRHLASQPIALRSLTIDHSLQPTSHASALRTHLRSLSLGVPNTIVPAEWGSTHHPPRKGAIEEAARHARYHALWRGIRAETAGAWEPTQTETKIGAGGPTVMFAHHADDQLETVVMRAMRGTGAYGMGGMRAVRRWGMGVGIGKMDNAEMGVGEGEDVLRGMKAWVCRPLLSVPKERILATCQAHGLEYEQDVTNFMPDLTVRNAVRHALSSIASAQSSTIPTSNFPIYQSTSNSSIHRPTSNSPTSQPPTESKAKTDKRHPDIPSAIQHIYSLATGSPTPLQLPPSPSDIECMRAYVQRMAERVRETDGAVTTYLASCIHPSPPSTLLITPHELPTDIQTQSALIHRILRYVSPHPWGSPESEAGRRRTSVQLILQRVWGITHDPNTEPRAFTAGAQVLWTPVHLFPNGQFRLFSALKNNQPLSPSPDKQDRHETYPPLAWLISRQPPPAQALHTLVRDVPRASGIGSLNVLWDNRFILRLRKDVDRSRGKLVIRPRGRLVLPEVVRVRKDGEERVKCQVDFIRELGAI